MRSCELCGRSMKGRGRDVIIEGASMLVCPQCAAKFGGQPTSSSETSTSHSSSRQQMSWTGQSERGNSSPSRTSHSARTFPKSKQKPRSAPTIDEMELIEDYAKVIRSARQKHGMSQEELAQKVGERVSTLQSIEAGRLKPTRKTTRGLERELEISLLEHISSVPLKQEWKQSKSSATTLGDVVKIKRKKAQKSE